MNTNPTTTIQPPRSIRALTLAAMERLEAIYARKSGAEGLRLEALGRWWKLHSQSFDRRAWLDYDCRWGGARFVTPASAQELVDLVRDFYRTAAKDLPTVLERRPTARPVPSAATETQPSSAPIEENQRDGVSASAALKAPRTRRKPTKQEAAAEHKKHQRRVRKAIIKREVLQDVGLKSFSLVRLTRLWYRDNAQPFIDIRVFSRGYDKAGREKFYPTRQGIHLWESDFTRLVESQFFATLDKQIEQDPR